MRTNTTLPHTPTSGGDHPIRSWHLSAYESRRGGWDAVAELPEGIRLEGHGPTRADAIADLAYKVTAYEHMGADDGGAL